MITVDSSLEYKYKKGDVVIIHKPDDISERPTWLSSFMDVFDGKMCHIRGSFTSDDKSIIYYTVVEDEYGFAFNENWLHSYMPETYRDEDIDVNDLRSLIGWI